jgi:hypothetical protein
MGNPNDRIPGPNMSPKMTEKWFKGNSSPCRFAKNENQNVHFTPRNSDKPSYYPFTPFYSLLLPITTLLLPFTPFYSLLLPITTLLLPVTPLLLPVTTLLLPVTPQIRRNFTP